MITDTELLVIRKAIHNLHTIGCKIAIVDKDGNEYGGYKLAPIKTEKKKRAALKYKRGTLSNYLDQYLFMLVDAGDVVEVPRCSLFPTLSKLNSAASAYMCNHHGKGSCKVETIPENDAIRVYRLDNPLEQMEKFL